MAGSFRLLRGGSGVRVLCSLGCLMAIVVTTGSAFAQQTQAGDPSRQRSEIDALREELDAVRARYEEELSRLGARLRALEAASSLRSPDAREPATAADPVPTAPLPAPASEAPSASPSQGEQAGPASGGAAAASKVFNPDMAVIGDFLGVAGHNAVQSSKTFDMHESEASFQAVVDPYARADFFMSFGEEGVDLEEGFLTFTSLPGGLLTRVGKMRAAFGKVNGLHNHVLPWADRPLVIDRLVGGEDGINDAGVSVAKLIPNPWTFLEATGQVFRGDSGADLFRSSSPGDLSYVGHLRGYHDLSESTNVDLGASYARGHNAAGLIGALDTGGFTTALVGFDATVRWRPLRRSIYHSFVGRAEAVWSRREQFDGPQRASGYYASGDYQFARRWFAGLRYDRSAHADNARLVDRGGSMTLTYWPSEFSQVRGQYRRTDSALEPAADEFLLQFQFSIGAHGAHPF